MNLLGLLGGIFSINVTTYINSNLQVQRNENFRNYLSTAKRTSSILAVLDDFKETSTIQNQNKQKNQQQEKWIWSQSKNQNCSECEKGIAVRTWNKNFVFSNYGSRNLQNCDAIWLGDHRIIRLLLCNLHGDAHFRSFDDEDYDQSRRGFWNLYKP